MAGYRECVELPQFQGSSRSKNNVKRPDYYHRFRIVVPFQLLEDIS